MSFYDYQENLDGQRADQIRQREQMMLNSLNQTSNINGGLHNTPFPINAGNTAGPGLIGFLIGVLFRGR